MYEGHKIIDKLYEMKDVVTERRFKLSGYIPDKYEYIADGFEKPVIAIKLNSNKYVNFLINLSDEYEFSLPLMSLTKEKMDYIIDYLFHIVLVYEDHEVDIQKTFSLHRHKGFELIVNLKKEIDSDKIETITRVAIFKFLSVLGYGKLIKYRLENLYSSSCIIDIFSEENNYVFSKHNNQVVVFRKAKSGVKLTAIIENGRKYDGYKIKLDYNGTENYRCEIQLSSKGAKDLLTTFFKGEIYEWRKN